MFLGGAEVVAALMQPLFSPFEDVLVLRGAGIVLGGGEGVEGEQRRFQEGLCACCSARRRVRLSHYSGRPTREYWCG
jgi:hypothetical protein